MKNEGMNSRPWRTVAISGDCSIREQDNQLCIIKDGTESAVPINQIRLLLFFSCQSTISLHLLSRLSENGVTIIVFNKKRKPVGEMIPMASHHESAGLLRDQADWSEKRKHFVWKKIVKMKISMQIELLTRLNLPVPDQLYLSVVNLRNDDVTNREAMAAKVYFHALFGNEFIRHKTDSVNSALNYGYTIICNAFTQAIVSQGYSTALGIHHCSRTNKVNLSCDMMEPFRPFVDEMVYHNQGRQMNWQYQREIVNLLYSPCTFDGKQTTIQNAIEEFTLDILLHMEDAQHDIREVGFADKP